MDPERSVGVGEERDEHDERREGDAEGGEGGLPRAATQCSVEGEIEVGAEQEAQQERRHQAPELRRGEFRLRHRDRRDVEHGEAEHAGGEDPRRGGDRGNGAIAGERDREAQAGDAGKSDPAGRPALPRHRAAAAAEPRAEQHRGGPAREQELIRDRHRAEEDHRRAVLSLQSPRSLEVEHEAERRAADDVRNREGEEARPAEQPPEHRREEEPDAPRPARCAEDAPRRRVRHSVARRASAPSGCVHGSPNPRSTTAITSGPRAGRPVPPAAAPSRAARSGR